MSQRQSGWGEAEKAARYRQAEEARRVVKPGANDAFIFKRKTQPNNHNTAAATPVAQPQVAAAQAPVAPTPVAATPSPSPPPPTAATSAAAAPQLSTPAPIGFLDDDAIEQKYASPSPSSSAPKSAAASTGPLTLCTMFVELFEMLGTSPPTPKAFGPKAICLERVPNVGPGSDPSFQMIFYAPVSKKTEFTLDLPTNFVWTALPDRFASFSDDATSRNWCIKFGTQEDAYTLGRCMALIGDVRSEAAFTRGGTRGILKQDLTAGVVDTPAVAIGDQVKCKYSVYAWDPMIPFSVGRVLYSTRDSAKYIVGAGGMLPGVEECLVGMRKRGCRLLVIPPTIANVISENAEFGPHVKPDTKLLIEVTISNIKPSIPVEDGSSIAEEKDQAEMESPTHTTTNGGVDGDDGDAVGVLNPTSIPAQATDLKTRMALLAQAQHGVVLGGGSSSGTTTPSGGGHTSMHSRGGSLSSLPAGLAATITTTTLKSSTAAPSVSVEPTVESFLSSLSLIELLPNFTKEGITYPDLFSLEPEELKQLVPVMGPRRRLQTKIQELKERMEEERKANAPVVIATPTPAPVVVTPTPVAVIPVTVASSTVSSRTPSSTTATPNPFSSTTTYPPLKKTNNAAARSQPTAAAATPTPAPTAVSSSTDLLPHDSFETPSQSHSSSSSKHFSHIHSQAQLDALLAAEYERGKNEMIQQAKTKIAEIKETASTRFQQLTTELEEARQQQEQDREKAREMVQRLREELKTTRSELTSQQESYQTLQQEKDMLQEKTTKYVSQLKAKYDTEKNSAAAEVNEQSLANMKSCMETLYTQLQATLKPKDLYEGEEMLNLIKNQVKSVIKQNTMKLG